MPIDPSMSRLNNVHPAEFNWWKTFNVTSWCARAKHHRLTEILARSRTDLAITTAMPSLFVTPQPRQQSPGRVDKSCLYYSWLSNRSTNLPALSTSESMLAGKMKVYSSALAIRVRQALHDNLTTHVSIPPPRYQIPLRH